MRRLLISLLGLFVTLSVDILAFTPPGKVGSQKLVNHALSANESLRKRLRHSTPIHVDSRIPLVRRRTDEKAAARWKLSMSSNGEVDYSKMEPKLYPQRWIQLIYLSLLALLSDWICFSVAASPTTMEAAYPGHSAASLIDMFLFTNVASCFLVTDVVAKFGLGKSIKGAAALMAAGCLLRSGGFVGSDVPYSSIVAGTILVGAAQPFFQCTPPMLSATWFASNERATSTAVALNFNQIGIATAFLVGGSMATSVSGLHSYFGLISVVTTIVTVGTFLQFQNKPLIPPSR